MEWGGFRITLISGIIRKKTEEVCTILSVRRVKKSKSLPASVDLREGCSPIEDQGGLGSCTAHAGVGIIEY